MNILTLKTNLRNVILPAMMLQASGGASAAQTLIDLTASNAPTVNLTAQRMSATLPDGNTALMWGFCTPDTGSNISGDPCPKPIVGTWAPGPTIIVKTGSPSLTINLTNSLPTPTSIVVLGQLGGGLGKPNKVPGPLHSKQLSTTWPSVVHATCSNAPANSCTSNSDCSSFSICDTNSNSCSSNSSITCSQNSDCAGSCGPIFTPPSQGGNGTQGGPRVQTFGTEVAPTTTTALTWNNLKPGTYLYETGTHPSIQAPMGLYGVLIVTDNSAAQANAYPGVPYDADATLLFSEIDIKLNKVVDAANGDESKYPPAVNYTPTYFLINGQAFDQSKLSASAFAALVPGTSASGNVLMRFVNAGLRTHIPSVVGLPMSLMAEDGNVAPGKPKVQSEILLTAGKTVDAVVNPPLGGTRATSYINNSFAVFDRQLSLSTGNKPNGGMQGYLMVAGSVTKNADGTFSPVIGDAFTAAVNKLTTSQGKTVAAVADSFKVPFNSPTYTANVLSNDVGIIGATLNTPPTLGTVTISANGDFTYTPNSPPIAPGSSPPVADTFIYTGAGTDGSSYTATVTLSVVTKGGAPTATTDAFTSKVASLLTVPQSGVLVNDTDPTGYPLTAKLDTIGTCASVNVNPDGSFTATGTPGGNCTFNYFAAGHALGGATIAPGQKSVTVLAPAHVPPGSPPGSQGLPTAQLSIFIYEDSSPTNGAVDGTEVNLGLGGFAITVNDVAASSGDPIGQMTYDAFNMPLTNALLGIDGCPATTLAGTPVGVVYTCPEPSAAEIAAANTPALQTALNVKYALRGHALIKYLMPLRYDVVANPAAAREGLGEKWIQTETLEGTKAQDAFAKAGEPTYFQEFGPPGFHTTIGFVNPAHVAAANVAPGPGSVKGQITNLHMSRPIAVTNFDSGSHAPLAHTTCYAGLNTQAGDGPNIAMATCDQNGKFTLSGIPDGAHELVIWDQWLDQIIGTAAVTVSNGAAVDMGTIPEFSWFTHAETSTFLDLNKDGVRQTSEPGIAEVPTTIRYAMAVFPTFS
jgi:FtsP/CotA-like multicopper oxidase with cupredoxin domain